MTFPQAESHEPDARHGYVRIARASTVGLGCFFVSLLLASPSWLQATTYVPNSARYGNRFHDVFAKQVADPFYRPTHEINKAWKDAGDFLAYRIFVPLVARGLGLGIWGGVALIWMAGVVAAALVYDFLVEHDIPNQAATLFVLSLGTTPFLQGSHIYLGFPDAVAWCCVAAMMRFRSPSVWGLLTFIGLFNDERMLLAIPLAYAAAFHGTRHDVLRWPRLAIPFVLAVLGGIAAALVVRYGIRTGFIGGAPLTGPELPPTGGKFPWGRAQTFSVLSSYAFFWALPLAALALDRLNRLFWGLVVAYAALAVYVSHYAFDFWRSLGAIYPLFVLSFLVLARVGMRRGKTLLLVLTASMLLRPQCYCAVTVRLLRPLPLALYELWRGESVIEPLKSWLFPSSS